MQRKLSPKVNSTEPRFGQEKRVGRRRWWGKVVVGRPFEGWAALLRRQNGHVMVNNDNFQPSLPRHWPTSSSRRQEFEQINFVDRLVIRGKFSPCQLFGLPVTSSTSLRRPHTTRAKVYLRGRHSPFRDFQYFFFKVIFVLCTPLALLLAPNTQTSCDY